MNQTVSAMDRPAVAGGMIAPSPEVSFFLLLMGTRFRTCIGLEKMNKKAEGQTRFKDGGKREWYDLDGVSKTGFLMKWLNLYLRLCSPCGIP